MKDDLKKFVSEHQKEIDLYSVDAENSWQVIERRLATHQRFAVNNWLKIAAVLTILAAVGITWYVSGSSTALPRQVAELEAYYSNLTQEKLQFIKTRNQNIDPAILQDLDTLDKAYEELKQDLDDDIDNEEVVSAMIQTYRAKLQILEQILEEIQHDTEDDKNDEVSI